MEKEKNTPPPVKKPTSQDITVIFAQSMCQKIEIQSPNFTTGDKIDVLTDTIKEIHSNGIIVGEQYEVELEYCQLLKTPLYKISKEHLEKLGELLFWDDNDYPVVFLHKNDSTYWFITDKKVCYIVIDHRGIIAAGKGIENKYERDNYVAVSGTVFHLCYQLLQEWGYALSYKNWSVDQLSELGIYKLTV